jgi:hypothetical protein
VSQKIIDEVASLADTSGVLSTPTGVEIQHKDIVNTNVGGSYLQFIEKHEKVLENIIIGRSTQPNDTTYASEKLRYLSTQEIEFADRYSLENIVNKILLFVK